MPLTAQDNKWLVRNSEVTPDGYSLVLDTAGKYLDKDIDIKVETKKGAISFGQKEPGSTEYVFTVTDGYLTQNDVDSVQLGDAVLSAEVNIDNSADYFTTDVTDYPVTATGSGSISAGFTAGGTVNAGVDGKGKTVYIKEGSLSNTKTAGVTYTEKSAQDGPILVSGGGLAINAGYIENTFIPLSVLVPDEANVTAESAPYIKKGTSAYDKDGTLITGTMENAVVAPSAEVSASNTITVTEAKVGEASNGVYTLEAETVAISGTVLADVTTVGYVEDDVTSTAVTGEASTIVKVDAATAAVKTLDVVGAKPALSSSVITDANVTDAAETGATTTAPSEGVYVKVDAAAAAGTKGSVSADINVTKAGYIKSGEVGEVSIDSTLADADSLYIPIKSGSATVTVDAISANDGITITGSQASGYTINVSAEGTTKPNVTEGWIKAIDAADVTVSGTKSIDASTVTQTGVVGTDYVVTASAGYNAADLTTSIPVYQGTLVGE